MGSQSVFYKALAKLPHKSYLESLTNRIEERLVTIGEEMTGGQIMKDILVGKGRRFRPTLLLICFDICSPLPVDLQKSDESSLALALDLAVAVELVHQASVIHDDVIDGAPIRREHESFFTRHSWQSAIVTGDLLLGQANSVFMRALETHRPILLTGLSNCYSDMVTTMAMGELDSLKTQSDALSNNLFDSQTVASLLQSNIHKSATATAAACRLGALACGSKMYADALTSVGNMIGQVFQLLDDIDDLEEDVMGTRLSPVVAYIFSQMVSKHATGHDPFSGLANHIVSGDLNAVMREFGVLEWANALIYQWCKEGLLAVKQVPECAGKDVLTSLFTMVQTVITYNIDNEHPLSSSLTRP